eukprot:scaffold84518_cov75-Phaeocystis_antarctica.AAC.1
MALSQCLVAARTPLGAWAGAMRAERAAPSACPRQAGSVRRTPRPSAERGCHISPPYSQSSAGKL